MKKLIIICFLFCSGISFGQYLQEQEWSKLSEYIASNDKAGFENFLNEKGFSKSDEANEKYTFYIWKTSEKLLYSVRVNKTSKQVTYLTNDQNYVLKLVSRFMSEYKLIKSEQQTKSTTHIFQSLNGTVAVKLDTVSDSGTHILFAMK